MSKLWYFEFKEGRIAISKNSKQEAFEKCWAYSPL